MNLLWEDPRGFLKPTGEYAQRNNLVSIGTRMLMSITDTPEQPFEKIQIDLVDPLPTRPRGDSK